MKIIRVHDYGEPEVMRLEHMGPPEPGAGQVRVRNEAIGVNYVDIYQRSGQQQLPLPFTLGKEAAGVIDMVGEGVLDMRVGDRVAYASVQGAYAEYTIAPADKVVPVPQDLDSRAAAALLLQGMTAHYLSHDTFPIQKGQTVLIHAAAGGMGQILVQLAKLRGARVLGTASTAVKRQQARDMGADEMFAYDDFDLDVKQLTGGHGVDVVYDSVGLDTFERSLGCLRPRGYMVFCGQSSGAVPPFDPQMLRARGSVFLTRPSLEHYTLSRDELLYRAAAVYALAAAGKLKVRIDRELPLAEAAEAHRVLASRTTTGKLLLGV